MILNAVSVSSTGTQKPVNSLLKCPQSKPKMSPFTVCKVCGFFQLCVTQVGAKKMKVLPNISSWIMTSTLQRFGEMFSLGHWGISDWVPMDMDTRSKGPNCREYKFISTTHLTTTQKSHLIIRHCNNCFLRKNVLPNWKLSIDLPRSAGLLHCP